MTREKPETTARARAAKHAVARPRIQPVTAPQDWMWRAKLAKMAAKSASACSKSPLSCHHLFQYPARCRTEPEQGRIWDERQKAPSAHAATRSRRGEGGSASRSCVRAVREGKLRAGGAQPPPCGTLAPSRLLSDSTRVSLHS